MIGSAAPSVLVAAAAVVAAWLMLRTLRAWYRLRHFKGPRIAALTRLWLARKVAGGTMHLDFHEVNEKYGASPRCR